MAFDPIDIHVGTRIRFRRKQLDKSQSDLASKLGMSFQQVQKYERGANRVSASVMYQAAQALGVTPAYFFEGFEALRHEALPEDARAAATWLTSAAAWPVAEAMSTLPAHHQKVVLRLAEDLATAGAA